MAPNGCPMAAAAVARKHFTSSNISEVSGSPREFPNDRSSRNAETLQARKVFRATAGACRGIFNLHPQSGSGGCMAASGKGPRTETLFTRKVRWASVVAPKHVPNGNSSCRAETLHSIKYFGRQREPPKGSPMKAAVATQKHFTRAKCFGRQRWP